MVTHLKYAFSRSLKKYPIVTNAVVYASFYTAAELSQQTYNKFNSVDKPDYDFKAVARIAGVGGTVYAPTLYIWYKYLDRKFMGTATKMVITKVAIDQFLMSPVLLAIFYIVMAALEGKEDLFEEMKQKYWQTFIANQLFWIPGQTINFYFVPPHLRVVYIASVAFVWINILCYIKRQKLKSETSKSI